MKVTFMALLPFFFSPFIESTIFQSNKAPRISQEPCWAKIASEKLKMKNIAPSWTSTDRWFSCLKERKRGVSEGPIVNLPYNLIACYFCSVQNLPWREMFLTDPAENEAVIQTVETFIACISWIACATETALSCDQFVMYFYHSHRFMVEFKRAETLFFFHFFNPPPWSA